MSAAGEQLHGDRHDPRSPTDVFDERHPIRPTEAADIGGQEVRTTRRNHLETEVVQARRQQVPVGLHPGGEVGEVGVRQRQADGDRGLKRPAGHVRQVLTHHPHGGDEISRAAAPAHFPTGERERLAAAAHGDCACAHPRQSGEGHMLVGGKDDVLIYLVAEHEQIVACHHLSERCEFGQGEHGAGGVVGGIEQNHPGARCDCGLDRSQIQGKPGRRARQRHPHRHPGGQRDPSPVDVEPRFRHDHFIAGVHQREQRGGEDFTGPGADHHLRAGVVVQTVETLLVVGNSREQLGNPVAGWVLVAGTVCDRGDCGIFEDLRTVDVRETLPEVDCP